MLPYKNVSTTSHKEVSRKNRSTTVESGDHCRRRRNGGPPSPIKAGQLKFIRTARWQKRKRNVARVYDINSSCSRYQEPDHRSAIPRSSLVLPPLLVFLLSGSNKRNTASRGSVRVYRRRITRDLRSPLAIDSVHGAPNNGWPFSERASCGNILFQERNDTGAQRNRPRVPETIHWTPHSGLQHRFTGLRVSFARRNELNSFESKWFLV